MLLQQLLVPGISVKGKSIAEGRAKACLQALLLSWGWSMGAAHAWSWRRSTKPPPSRVEQGFSLPLNCWQRLLTFIGCTGGALSANRSAHARARETPPAEWQHRIAVRSPPTCDVLHIAMFPPSELQSRLECDHARTAIATQSDT